MIIMTFLVHLVILHKKLTKSGGATVTVPGYQVNNKHLKVNVSV